jgi:hypothetical protein
MEIGYDTRWKNINMNLILSSSISIFRFYLLFTVLPNNTKKVFSFRIKIGFKYTTKKIFLNFKNEKKTLKREILSIKSTKYLFE